MFGYKKKEKFGTPFQIVAWLTLYGVLNSLEGSKYHIPVESENDMYALRDIIFCNT